VRQFEEAITAHLDAATLFRETGDRHREIIVLENLGESTISGLKVRNPAYTHVHRSLSMQVTRTDGRAWTLANGHGLQHKLQSSGGLRRRARDPFSLRADQLLSPRSREPLPEAHTCHGYRVKVPVAHPR